jgi:hypothetical protein
MAESNTKRVIFWRRGVLVTLCVFLIVGIHGLSVYFYAFFTVGYDKAILNLIIYWGFIIPFMLLVFSDFSVIEFFQNIFDFLVYKIRTRFFPDKFQKSITAILDGVKKSDVYLAEIVRRRGLPDDCMGATP